MYSLQLCTDLLRRLLVLKFAAYRCIENSCLLLDYNFLNRFGYESSSMTYFETFSDRKLKIIITQSCDKEIRLTGFWGFGVLGLVMFQKHLG